MKIPCVHPPTLLTKTPLVIFYGDNDHFYVNKNKVEEACACWKINAFDCQPLIVSHKMLLPDVYEVRVLLVLVSFYRKVIRKWKISYS